MKGKRVVHGTLSKCQLSLLTPSLCQQLVLMSYSRHDYLPISMHIFLGLFSNVAFCIVNRGKWLGRLERIIKEANKQATVFVGRPLTRTAHLLFYVD